MNCFTSLHKRSERKTGGSFIKGRERELGMLEKHPSMNEGCLSVLFVTFRSANTSCCTLGIVGMPQLIGVHQVCFIMFWPTREKLLNVGFFSLKHYLTQNLKLWGNLGALLLLVEGPYG
jgi:hypothetical protein